MVQLQQTDADNDKNQAIESVKQGAEATGEYVSEREGGELRKAKKEG
jgi:hypothetical protein